VISIIAYCDQEMVEKATNPKLADQFRKEREEMMSHVGCSSAV